MEKLVEEVKQWNTPSIGAYLLWQFTAGYCDSHPNGEAPVALLHFLAVPLLTSKKLLTPISNRRRNLQSYVKSFEDSQSTDILITIQDRAKNNLTYTMEAIDIAVSAGLLFWDVETGILYPRKDVKRPRRGNALKSSLTKAGNKAKIICFFFYEQIIPTFSNYIMVLL